MKKLLILFAMMLGLLSCHDTDYSYLGIKNAESTLGIEIYPNHDWCSTISGNIKVVGTPNIDKVQLLVYTNSGDENKVLKIVNQASCNGSVVLNYDIPSTYDKLYVNFISKDGQYYFREFTTNDKEVSLTNKSKITRADVNGLTLPDDPVLFSSLYSYARTRNYPGFENEVLYQQEDEYIINVDNYSEELKSILRAVIFTYLPNGRDYDNLPQIKESGYYNEKCYGKTTSDKPVIVSPIYKNDGGYHEVETADLYYYYFDPNNLPEDTVGYFKSLPKYKAIQLNKSVLEDDTLKKHHSYALIYWGDETPVIGETVGSYYFPDGYEIGFMLRSNFSNNVKKGELYFDGRLNEKINKHGHFASSGFGPTDPRMCWITVNEKNFICCEEGTDRDFNDVIFEVEGLDILVPPPFEYNYFTFCFEDQDLGDYDLNDVVLKGTRLDDTHVEWTLMACGANDELVILNVEGKHINKDNEVHSIFGKTPNIFINTQNTRVDYVTDTVIVNKEFSFLDPTCQPSIYDKNTKRTITIAVAGQDPHAIMIPYDFKWPLERVRVNTAYLEFNEWGQNPVMSTEWYKHPETGLIYE